MAKQFQPKKYEDARGSVFGIKKVKRQPKKSIPEVKQKTPITKNQKVSALPIRNIIPASKTSIRRPIARAKSIM